VTASPRARLLAAVLLAVLVWLVVYPLVLVLLEGVRDPSGWTLRYVRLFFERPTEWSALWGSLWISLASVALAAAIGIPLAFLFGRYELPGGRVLGGLVALPAVLPPLVGVLAFLFLYGETGFVSLLVQRLLGVKPVAGKRLVLERLKMVAGIRVPSDGCDVSIRRHNDRKKSRRDRSESNARLCGNGAVGRQEWAERQESTCPTGAAARTRVARLHPTSPVGGSSRFQHWGLPRPDSARQARA